MLVFATTLPNVNAQTGIDRDQDKIPDNIDDCPVLPEDYEGIMDDDGCPDLYLSTLDTDRDGVSDLYDQCPDAMETHNKYLDEDGCPDVSPAEKNKGVLDADNDGITDKIDRCPSQPETYNKFMDRDGCPDELDPQRDTDRDGLKDTVDQCPTQGETYNQFQDEDGCPDRVVSSSPNAFKVDTDNDGVPDVQDRCKADPETYNQFKDNDGCPDEILPAREYIPGTRDSDKDGFLNSEDACPNEPETWNKYKDDDGCPDVYPKETFGVNGNAVHVDEQTEVTLTGEGTDPDNDKLSYMWVQTEGEHVTLSSASSTHPTFIAPDVGNGETKTLKFDLTVDDGFGGTDTDSVEIIVDSINHFPTVDAGPDQTADVGEEITLFGSGSDPDGDRLSYIWIQIGGAPVSLSAKNTASTTFTVPSGAKDKVLTFQLVGSDGYGGSARDTVSVSVGGERLRLLVADAGPDQTVDEGDQVSLDGSESHSPHGESLTFSWVQTFGDSVEISDADTDSPSFTAPAVKNGETKILAFKLIVSADKLGSATDVVIIRVKTHNSDPSANAGSDQTVNTRATVTLAGSGSDPNGDKIRYSWKQTSGQSVRLSSPTISTPTFIAPVVANGQTKTLTFELSVSDGQGGTDSDTVTITVKPVNHKPSANAGDDQSVQSGDEVTLSGTGKDPDHDPITFSWTQLGGASVDLSSDDTSKTSFTAPELAKGETRTVQFELTVSDGRGGIAKDTTIVTVTGVNSPPTADAGSDQTVNEGTEGRLAGSGSDPDGDSLSYSWEQTGGPDVTLSSATSPSPTFTAPTVDANTKLTFQLTVNDGTTDSESDTVIVTIKDIPPRALVANAGGDKIVDESVTVTLDGSGSHDPEGGAITYSWKQVSGESVTLSSTTVAKPTFTSPSVENGETQVLVFELTVTDGKGRTATDTVKITVDPVNADPTAKAGVLRK